LFFNVFCFSETPDYDIISPMKVKKDPQSIAIGGFSKK